MPKSARNTGQKKVGSEETMHSLYSTMADIFGPFIFKTTYKIFSFRVDTFHTDINCTALGINCALDT